MSFLGNIGYILVGFVLIVSIFLIILAILEKRLHIRFVRGRHWQNQLYIVKLSKIDLTHIDQSLRFVSNLAKSFFREAFHIKGSPEYSELEDFFKKKNNKKGIEFSRQMTKFLYSGTQINKEELQKLVTLLAEIIGSNKIITKEEQKELDKKSQEHLSPLRKVKILSIGKKKLQKKDKKTE